MKVIKRDGRIKDFDQARIKEAIRKAYMDIYNGSEEKFGDDLKIGVLSAIVFPILLVIVNLLLQAT